MGAIDTVELRAMLSVQAELRAERASGRLETLAKRFRLGKLLVESGIIDEPTLGAALALSRRTGRRLGETLVCAGAISSEVLQRTLERQRRLMAIALSSMALSNPMMAAAADTTQIRVSASVMARATIETQRLPTELLVSAEDVARGFVDVPVEIGVRSNHALVVGFSSNAREVAGVAVSAGSAFVPQTERGMRAHTVSVRVRLKLAPQAQPGRIALPLTVCLTPA